jgi:hypothetical protein
MACRAVSFFIEHTVLMSWCPFQHAKATNVSATRLQRQSVGSRKSGKRCKGRATSPELPASD